MTETVEEKVVKPDFKVRLSEKYAIDTDTRNIILLERYEKHTSKGKNAELSGEFGWRSVGVYFQTFDRLADWLVKHEMFTSDGITELKHFADVVENLKSEIARVLVEKVEVKID